MNFVLCHLSVVPIRSTASDKSEQISQLLFGETAEILEWKGRSWIKARCISDHIIGWVQARQVKPLTQREAERFAENFAYCLDLFQPLLSDDNAMPVPMGSRLPDFDGMKFRFDGKTYRYSGQAVFPQHLDATPDRVIKLARRLLCAPYQWGGRSPLGLDASGFIQLIFKIVGISLHRSAKDQVLQGRLVNFIEEAMPGDVAFFENQQGVVVHTGLIVPEGKIIHASEMVRTDRLDHFGIFNEETQKYTYRLRLIKRLLNTDNSMLPARKELKPESAQPALF